MNKTKRIAIYVFALILAFTAFSSASAQSIRPLTEEEQSLLPAHPNFMPPDIQYRPVSEPVFDKITFLKLERARSLSGRIEALIHGIYVDLPPEYDHYGYEIRRYMASIAGPDVLGSPKNLEKQIQNIKKAEVILRYWRKNTQEKISAIENEIEQSNASPSTRSSFKYHRGVAEAFFIEAEIWIRNNRATLEYLLRIGPDAYEFKSQRFTFKNRNALLKFASLYKAREAALKEIQGYTPFHMMVY